MHAGISVHASTATRNWKRSFRGAKTEAETIRRDTKQGFLRQGLANARGMGSLMSLAGQTKLRGRFLSRREERTIFSRYQRARRALEKLEKDQKELEKSAAKSKARKIEHEIRCNKNVIRIVQTIVDAAHLGLLHKIAKRHIMINNAHHLSEEDLVQEARYTVIQKAMKRFDLGRGVYFSTYGSYWARQAIQRAIMNAEREVRIPVHVYNAVQRLHNLQRLCLTKEGREPTEEEISGGIRPEAVRLMTDDPTRMKTVSMHESREGKGGKKWNLLARLPDENAEDPEQAAIRNEDRRRAMNMLDSLDPKERKIIIERFGLDGEREHTLKEVGEEFRVTKESIRQRERRALCKLREKAERQTGCCRPRDGNGQSEPLNATINK